MKKFDGRQGKQEEKKMSTNQQVISAIREHYELYSVLPCQGGIPPHDYFNNQRQNIVLTIMDQGTKELWEKCGIEASKEHKKEQPKMSIGRCNGWVRINSIHRSWQETPYLCLHAFQNFCPAEAHQPTKFKDYKCMDQ